MIRLAAITLAAALLCHAQQASDTPDWQIKAGGKMSFDVASIKLSPPGARNNAGFPLDNGDAFQPTSLFSAVDPLWTYILFAYKYSPNGRRMHLI
jgi:hypothetical protein